METKTTITDALILVQNELKVPKGNLNKFGNYKYRSAEDILEAVKPILKKHNVAVFLTDDIIQIGTKVFLKAMATFTNGVEMVQVNGFAETSEHKGMSAEQTTGTASSYARKYALNGLFLIDETEADADSQKPEEKKEATKPEPKEMEWLSEENFIKAMQSPKKGILATLQIYNGLNGKTMSNSYKEQLTKQLANAK